MKASQAGHMECVQVLLDKGADVNMQNEVSGVIIHCVHAMQHVPRVPGSESRHVRKNSIVCIHVHATLFNDGIKYISDVRNVCMMITSFTKGFLKR